MEGLRLNAVPLRVGHRLRKLLSASLARWRSVGVFPVSRLTIVIAADQFALIF